MGARTGFGRRASTIRARLALFAGLRDETSQLATIADLRACYRLLLGRGPDPRGFEYWKSVVDRGIPVNMLVRGFLRSPEFEARRGMEGALMRVEADGFVIEARPGDLLYGPHFVAHGEYEPHVTDVVRERLGNGSVFLDVGANIGYFTLLAATLVQPGGRVVAIEAKRENAELCARNIAANGFEHVTLHHVAASDAPGMLQVVGGPLDSNARVAEASDSGEEMVEAVRLDDLLRDTFERLDLVKLDVEGYEPRAAAGMRALLERFRPQIIAEVNPSTLALAGHPDVGILATLLAGLGYEALVIEHDRSGLTPARPEELASLVVKRGLTHLDMLFVPRADGPPAAGRAA